MLIVERISGREHFVKIESVNLKDYRKITKRDYYFNWKTEKENEVYKLVKIGSEEILGLVSLIECDDERIQINLLSVLKGNRGKEKTHEGIAGNLIAWACKEAVKRFGENACVSLVPKTKLKQHYINEYGMLEAGQSVFLSEEPLLTILNKYGL